MCVWRDTCAGKMGDLWREISDRRNHSDTRTRGQRKSQVEVDKPWENRGFGLDLKVWKQVHTFVLNKMDTPSAKPSCRLCEPSSEGQRDTGQIQGQEIPLAVRITTSYTEDKGEDKVNSRARAQEICERVIHIGFPGSGHVIPSSSGHLGLTSRPP